MPLIYNTVSIFTLLVAIWLFKHASGSMSLKRLNTISFIFYKEVLPVAFIGVMLVVNNLVDNHYVIRVIDDSVKVKGWFFALYSLICMPISMIFLNLVTKTNVKKKYARYLEQQIQDEYPYNFNKFISLLFASISIITLIYVFINSPSIPIYTAIVEGDLLKASIQRVEVKWNFKGIVYIKNLIGIYLMPIITYQSFIYLKRYKTFIFKIIFTINFICTTLLLIYDTQKAPVLVFILGFLIVKVLIDGKLRASSLIFSFIFVFSLLIIFYIFIAGKDFKGLMRFDSVIVYRIFVGQIAGYFLSLQWFPNVITQNTAYIGLPNVILKAFDLPNIESARLLMMYFNPEGVNLGNAGLMNSYYLGEAWANYGYAGLLLAPIIVGIVIQMVHLWLLTSKKTSINIAFYACITTKWLVTGGIVNFLYLKQLIIPIILYCFYKLVVQIFLGILLPQNKNIRYN